MERDEPAGAVGSGADGPGESGESPADRMAREALERMRSMARARPWVPAPTVHARRGRFLGVIEGGADGDTGPAEGNGSPEPAGGGGPGDGGTTRPPSRIGWTKSPGLAASRTRWREPLGLGAALGRLTASRGWSPKAAMGSVMARWGDIVGPDVAAHCAIETFEGKRLVVRCTSTAWAKQLVLLLPHIERRIAEEVGPGVVDQVVVRGPSAPSWRRGPRVAPGRGPRDTYG